MPIGGNRNRAKVDDAISIYEETMGRRLGFGKAIEVTEVHDVLKQRAGGEKWAIDRAKNVREIRNNERHFPGLSYGRERAEKDIRYIAETLEEFSETQEAARVRKLTCQRGTYQQGTRQRGPSTRQDQRATNERTNPVIVALVIVGIFIVFPYNGSPSGASIEISSAPARLDQPVRVDKPAPTPASIAVPQDKQVLLEKETISIHGILPSTDQPSTPNPTAIPDVPIPTVTPAPSPTPNPYHLSTSLKPSAVQQLYDADGGLLSSQNYEIAACYYDPHNTGTPPKWKLFTQPDQSLLEPVFAIHFNEPINLQHGLCYDFNVSYMGPTEWRVCASQPYGGNCDHNSSDFLWEREIPAFRGNPDSATYIWKPDPDKRQPYHSQVPPSPTNNKRRFPV